MDPEDALRWMDEKSKELAAGIGLAVFSTVARWLAEGGQPFRLLRMWSAKRIAEANALAGELAEDAVDVWAAREAGVEVQDLPPAYEAEASDDEDDFAAWDAELGALVGREEARLAAAVDAIFDGEAEQIEKRMQRLAESEPVRSSRERARKRMRARGVTEYVRVVEPGACEPCADRVGEVRSIDVPFTDHPGCRCSLRPKVAQGWGDEVKARAFQLRHVSRSGVRFSAGLAFGKIEREESANG